jgi:gliding motility-associated-like protein
MAIINGVRYTTDTIVRDTTFAPCGLATIFATDTLHFYDPTITIVSSAALPIVAGEPTQLSILPPGNYQNVVWSPDYQISNLFALSPIVSPREDTTYYVTLENEQHCIVKAQISIPVVGTNTPDFLMPTAFTPNGDGLNDLYRPVIKITPVDVQSFQVYDRWGLKVYDSQITGIVGWDGTYRNVAQPIGVYIYYITAKVSNGTIVSQSGNVTLIR